METPADLQTLIEFALRDGLPATSPADIESAFNFAQLLVSTSYDACPFAVPVVMAVELLDPSGSFDLMRPLGRWERYQGIEFQVDGGSEEIVADLLPFDYVGPMTVLDSPTVAVRTGDYASRWIDLGWSRIESIAEELATAVADIKMKNADVFFYGQYNLKVKAESSAFPGTSYTLFDHKVNFGLLNAAVTHSPGEIKYGTYIGAIVDDHHYRLPAQEDEYSSSLAAKNLIKLAQVVPFGRPRALDKFSGQFRRLIEVGCKLKVELSNGEIFFGAFYDYGGSRLLEKKVKSLPPLEGTLFEDVFESIPDDPSLGLQSTISSAGGASSSAKSVGYTGELGDLTVPERLKVYVWIRSVTLHVDRVPEYFTIRAGLNGGVAAVSEVYSLHDLQKISADAGEPLLPVTIQLPFGQFGFIVYYTDEITVDSASIFVELKAWSADSPDNLVESEVGLIVPHVSEVPGGGELVWGVPDGKISQNYSIMSPDNRFSADIVLGSLEAEQKVLLPENWGPFPMQLNPLVTHAWVAGASGDNWELEARYLVGTPDWLIPEEEGWDCPPTIFFERSLGVKSMKLKKTPDNFPNGENAWYPLGETPIYTPDNFLMVGAPLTLQFMMYQLSGGKKKNIKEFNAEVPVMPVLSDYGSQFKHTVFVPNWVTIGDDKAGVMVRFENETQQGAIPPLKTGLILFDGDQTLPGTAIVDSAAGNMGSHTIQIDQTTIGQVLVLGYSIPWANLGGITLQTFPLKEFDEWAASIDWSAVAPSDQQTVPDPTESLEPLEHVELEQPQPYDDWYPAGFFGTNSSYVKPANLQDQQLRSTLYFKLEPPLQSKALWIHVAMAGVLLTSTLRIDVLP